MFEELNRFRLVTSSETDAGPEMKQLESTEEFLQWMQQEVEVEMVGNSDALLDGFRGFLGKRERECGMLILGRVRPICISVENLDRLSIGES